MNDIELSPEQRDIFYSTVWKIVQQVPPGKVTTYGQIAAFIPCPSGITDEDYKVYRSRWVGHAMAACPPTVPWQRVINSQGKISLRGGAERQHELLVKEGITFDARDRVDLKQFGWTGPSLEWLKDNRLIGPEGPQQLSFFS